MAEIKYLDKVHNIYQQAQHVRTHTLWAGAYASSVLVLLVNYLRTSSISHRLEPE